MKIINNSENAICHGSPLQNNLYRVEVGQVIEVPNEIGKLWLNIKGVKEYAAPSDVKKAEEKIKELESKLKELEAPKKETEKKAKAPAKKGGKK